MKTKTRLLIAVLIFIGLPGAPAPAGIHADYSTYLGGTGWDEAYGIAVEGGAAYVTGNTDSLDFPTVNPYQAGLDGTYDAFVGKFSSDGSSLVYSTYLGGAMRTGLTPSPSRTATLTSPAAPSR